MNATHTILSLSGWSNRSDPSHAFAEIFGDSPLRTSGALGIVFVCANYNLQRLGEVLKSEFPFPFIACTTAGEISGDGYRSNGIGAAILGGVDARVAKIDDIESFDAPNAEELARQLGAGDLTSSDQAVMLTLFDGMCMCEERLSSLLYTATGGVPMVGASSGDDLTFTKTPVYYDGAFAPGVSVCALVKAPAGIRTFRSHHYEDTGEALVVTLAEPSTRKIIELNGLPAREAYAKSLGIDPGKLSKIDELLHPLMVEVGGSRYVRGVRELFEDGSMQLYCAIEEGLVLHVGRSADAQGQLHNELETACTGMKPSLILMFDCITRRLEADHLDSRNAFASAISEYPIMGFSTYGEQYNGVHVNQTATGVIFGEAA